MMSDFWFENKNLSSLNLFDIMVIKLKFYVYKVGFGVLLRLLGLLGLESRACP